MKKVRYLAGAVGVAPVLGMMMPPGNGVAAVTHTTPDKGKTVSLAHLRATRPGNFHPRNFSDCPTPRVLFTSRRGSFEELVFGQSRHSCISRVSGSLRGDFPSLDMRTRFYNANGGKVGGDHFNIGHLSPARRSTVWTHTTTTFARRACIALVVASPNHALIVSPICTGT